MRGESIHTDGVGCAGPSSVAQNGVAGSEQNAALLGVGSGVPSPRSVALLSVQFEDMAEDALRRSHVAPQVLGLAGRWMRYIRSAHDDALSAARFPGDLWFAVACLAGFAAGSGWTLVFLKEVFP